MEFLFQLSAYDDPALDGEAVQLMDLLLEANSRNAVPGLWKLTDKLNAYAGKSANRKKHTLHRRIHGAVLLALGIFLLVPGLAKPNELLIPLIAGAAGVLLGLSLLLQKKDLTAGDPADFLSYLQESIDKHVIKTDKESTT